MPTTDDARPRVHLLGMDPGQRFALDPDPGGDIYELVEEVAAGEDGKEAMTWKARDPLGRVLDLAEIPAMNGWSYFVYQVEEPSDG